MSKILITGATGFIGGHLVKETIKRGNQVRIMVRPGNPAYAQLKKDGYDIVSCDISDTRAVEKAADNMDIIFHCAASVTDWAPKKIFESSTVEGTQNICMAAAKADVKRLVHVSTNDVFGYKSEEIIDESYPLSPWNEPYPDYKIKAEEICWLFHREQGLPVTMVYPCWVFGENDYTLTADLADAVIKKDMIFWQRKASFYPVYIENLVDLMMIIAEDERAIGNGYIAHDGESTTLQEFCDRIAETLEVEPVTRYIPYPVALFAAKAMETIWTVLQIKKRPLLTTYLIKCFGSHHRYSIEKAEKELGWTPKISFEEGMARTMHWLKTVDRTKLKTK